MSSLTLITRAVSSGKADHHLLLAAPAPCQGYIATAPTNLDSKMDGNIPPRRGERDESYATIDGKIDLPKGSQNYLALPSDTIVKEKPSIGDGRGKNGIALIREGTGLFSTTTLLLAALAPLGYFALRTTVGCPL